MNVETWANISISYAKIDFDHAFRPTVSQYDGEHIHRNDDAHKKPFKITSKVSINQSVATV